MNKFIVEDCWKSEVPEENPVPAPLRQLQKPTCTGMNFIPYKVKEVTIRILAITYGCGTT